MDSLDFEATLRFRRLLFGGFGFGVKILDRLISLCQILKVRFPLSS